MESGKLKVKPLITHRFSIEKATQAYNIITGKKKENFLGVLLTYPKAVERLESSKVVRFNLPPFKPAACNLGVIGAGLFANSVLLPAIKKVNGIQLIGIASTGGLHAQHAGKKFGFKYATSSDDEILNDPKINTIAILTSHDSHADLVVKALKAGKHVFVEKPLAINSAQLSAVSKQLMAKNQSFLTVGFNRRFAPLARSLKFQISSLQSPLHIHYRINAGYLPPNHWNHDPAVGGGRIVGEACHFVDFITFLVGAVPLSVTAHALPDVGKYREDNVSMTFTFADGSIGVVDYLANGDKSFPKERVEVFCGGMVAVLDDFVSLQTTQNGKMKEERVAQDKGWGAEIAALVESIQMGGDPPIPYEQLIGVTKSTLAAVESLRSSKSISI